MSTTDEIILLTDEFTGLEYSWKRIGSADPNADNVLTKNIGNYKYERMFEVADVRWWGIMGDSTDESTKLNQMLADIKDNKKVNEIAFYGLEKVVVDSTLDIQRGDLIIDGKNCELSASYETDIVIFNIDNTNNQYVANNICIKNFISGNKTTAQTFVKAKSSHYLRVTDCRFEGMKLGIDLQDCYFTKINSVYFQSVYQAFKFYNATNAFNVTNMKVHGAGIPSEITNTTTGGNISGSSFEDASGRLILDRCFGLNITGNYFEGYNENKVDTYILLNPNSNYEWAAGINISGNLFYTGAMQALKMHKVAGISITGNYFGTLHAVRINADKSDWSQSTQKNINYSGNAWRYTPSQQVGIPATDSSEFIGDFDVERANISPEWNVPIIFTPQVFHGRYFEDGDHQIAASKIDSSTHANYMTHTWQTNGKKSKAYLNGSIDLFDKQFIANESIIIDIEPFGYGSTLGTLLIHNSSGGFAMFLWQRNINNTAKTGYFKEITNDLGISVIHNDGSITFTNGSNGQYLKAELKV
ncbi:hypothetical protein FY557_19760 [Chryseobacterium sp. SN22]|uniref:hypothetical protein n=1 Tax=Chryseobacterium sp. SN22 TaxID=2606431 RepID=UPI0011EE338C|nr:hypothetical protein [Chryseobacterium sp. SN22]KAA0125982.1 hypothetical protein FY557_19760 [Chryseobacterium sp. SN22]